MQRCSIAACNTHAHDACNNVQHATCNKATCNMQQTPRVDVHLRTCDRALGCQRNGRTLSVRSALAALTGHVAPARVSNQRTVSTAPLPNGRGCIRGSVLLRRTERAPIQWHVASMPKRRNGAILYARATSRRTNRVDIRMRIPTPARVLASADCNMRDSTQRPGPSRT